MADHNKPVLTSTYANFVSELDARFDDLSLGLDPAVTTATNVPVGTLRWNSALGKDQKWNGSTWGDKSSFYALGSVRFSNGSLSSPSITFSDDTTTGISKLGSEVVHSVSGTRVIGLTSDSTIVSNKLTVEGHVVVANASGNTYDTSAIEVRGAGNTNPAIKPSVGFHQPGIFAGSLRQDDTLDFGFYQGDAGAYANLSVLNLNASGVVSSVNGFQTPSDIPNSRNPIWRFGNSQSYGISYFQGTSGLYGGDSIGMHFGIATSSGSQFSFTNGGKLVTHGNITSGVAAIADSGTNITVNGVGTSANNAPYFTVNSRGMVAGHGSQFTSGGLLFASYRDVRTTAYVGGITMRVENVNDVTTFPIRMDFHIGQGAGQSFATDGNAALPSAPMSLSAEGNLSVSTSVVAPSFVGVASHSNSLKVIDPLSTQPDRNLSNIIPSANPSQLRTDFANSSVTGTGGSFAGVLTVNTSSGTVASGNGPSYQLGFGSTENNGGLPQFRIRNGIDATWNTWYDVVTSANYQGIVTDVPTQSAGNSTTKIASTEHVTAKINSMFNVEGNAPLYACRAWVNFSGTGTVAIRAGGNVSSITDNGQGEYTVNFTSPMVDADYALVGSTQPSVMAADVVGINPNVAPTTSAVSIITHRGGSGNVDVPRVMICVFR